MYPSLHAEGLFPVSLTTSTSDRFPYIAFVTDDARFTFELSPNTYSEESTTNMRLVIAQLGPMECEHLVFVTYSGLDLFIRGSRCL